jgi:hypothetical protein
MKRRGVKSTDGCETTKVGKVVKEALLRALLNQLHLLQRLQRRPPPLGLSNLLAQRGRRLFQEV